MGRFGFRGDPSGSGGGQRHSDERELGSELGRFESREQRQLKLLSLAFLCVRSRNETVNDQFTTLTRLNI